MKILLCSHFFHPSIGGIEQVSEILAREFVAAGHEVKVVTQSLSGESSNESSAEFSFEIHRRPRFTKLLHLVGWSDVIFHNNLSLQTAWPLLFINRPWVVAHHYWFERVDGSVGLRDRLKHLVVRGARNIAVSEAIRAELAAPAVVIGNPYRDDLFRRDETAVRDRELVFLGRIIPGKGLEILFQALALLKKGERFPKLTVIGGGQDYAELTKLREDLRLESQIDFATPGNRTEVAALLNRHKIIVVPSYGRESFGLVALEGMACGCVPVVSRCGGLPDAAGPCGIVAEPRDPADLAAKLAMLLDPRTDLEPYLSKASDHLSKHTARQIAMRYLGVIESAVRA